MEKIVKGFSNHRRIMMMELLQERTELTLDAISQELKINLKTASEHLRRLALADLVEKRYQGRYVLHQLTPRAKNILTFLRKLE